MSPHLQRLDTKKVEFYTLEKDGLRFQLDNINNRKGASSTVYFPDTRGKMVPFRIQEAPVMSEALTARYPEIRSYKGYSLQNNKDRIRISVSPKGVQTMIVHADKRQTTFMDKASDDEVYVVYQKSASLSAKSDFICDTEAAIQEKPSASSAKLVDDQILRRYRLAVSATGEYTQFHGGTKAGALAAINATLTRVNGVFETDLAITLQLIANTDDVIFTNPATDPYSGNFNTEVQNTLTTLIGEANYDVGHLFHQDIDNGNAGFIGSVCRDGQKGSAFSSGANPQGDIFDLDFVSHELGHQFGANHTWSFDTEGTGVQAEPASGTTIMGYAGIVPGNNVEPNGDEYFHYNSILQIAAYVAAQTCAEEIALTNNPPVITPSDDFIIPRSTAFVLEGAATDADPGDVLTYAWEQIDDGIVTTLTFGPDNVSGANFRSRRPVTSARRYFPMLSEVAQGNLTQTLPAESSAWETVSDIEREFNFALTVRDNASGGGQVASDLVKVNVIESAGPFTVTSQASQETVIAGSAQLVSWDVANTNSSPINAQFVDIYLSTDGGLSFPTLLLDDTPNDGSAEVLIPGQATTQGRFMIKANNNIFFAVNASDIIIEESEIVLQFDNLEFEVCQPDDLIVPFTYEAFSGFSELATFSAVGAPPGLGVAFNPTTAIADDTPVTVTFSGTDMVAPGTYPITIRAATTSVTKDVILNLSVLSTSFGDVVLNSPASGAVDVSLSESLSWEAEALATSYELEIATDVGFTNIVETATLVFTSYQPALLDAGTTYFWRVKPVNSCGEGSFGSPFGFTLIDVNCKTISASGLPITISSSGTPTVTAAITVFDDLPLADVNVRLNIDHTFLADLVITLRSPAGTEVRLVSNSCGNLMNIDAVFDHDANNFVCGNDPAISGTVKPLGSLATFNGESAAGEWLLTVDDQFNADGGAINVFDLEICVEGAFKPDTDGDGVFDEDDLCPGTPAGAEVGVDGCEIFRFAPDNFTVAIESEACIGSNDGQINITAQTSMDYTVNVTGAALNVNDSFTSSYTLNNVSGGTYTVCINGTDGPDVFEEVCFELIVDEPDPLSVSSVLSADGNEVLLNLSGSELYFIEINGELLQTSESQVNLDLKNGLNNLKVSTGQSCQGSYEEEIFVSSVPIVYPNPFEEIAFVNLFNSGEDATITVHSSDGRLIMSAQQNISEVEMSLDFTGLPSGMYFVRIQNKEMNKTYKVIKR